MDHAHILARVKELQTGMGKKASFEASVTELTRLLEHLPGASKDVQVAMYEAVCRSATLLKTRYGASTIGTVGVISICLYAPRFSWTL